MPGRFNGLPGLPQDKPAPAVQRTASAYQFTQSDLYAAAGATMTDTQLSIDQAGLCYAILGADTGGQVPGSVTFSGTMHGLWLGVSDYTHGVWHWAAGPLDAPGVIDLPAAGTLSPAGKIYLALVCPLTPPADQAWAEISLELDIEVVPDVWNLIVWLAGDNDLATYAAANLNAMETVGSTEELRILAGFDINPALATGISGLSQVGFIKVVQNTNPYAIITDGDAANALYPRAGYDSSDPANLAQFIAWVKSNFPARHNALILWDHGDGWLPGPKGASMLPGFKPRRQASGILGDYTDGGFVLTDNTGVAQALSGLHFDLLCFDACNMAQIEALYDFRHTADWVSASEALVPAAGYPYAQIISAWGAALPATPQALATIVADQTIAYYTDNTYIGQAVLDTSRLDPLVAALKDVADAVIPNADVEGPLVQVALGAAFQPELSDGERDLHGFLQYYLGLTGDAAIQNKLLAAIDACNSYVTYYTQYAQPDTSGIAAFLPNIPFFGPEYQDRYTTRAFNSATGWLDMLKATGVPQGDGTGVSLYWVPGDRIEIAWSDTNADIDLGLFDPAGNFGAPWDPTKLQDSVLFSQDSEASGDDLEWGQLKDGAPAGVYYVNVASNAYHGGPPPATYAVSVKLYDSGGVLKRDLGICTVGYQEFINYATLEYPAGG